MSPLFKTCLAKISRLLGCCLLFCLSSSLVCGQVGFDHPPIDYLKSQPDDVIARLQRQIDQGQVQLKHDEHGGYLRAVLAALNVPVSSQGLVYSKTSFQLRKISPETPRAVFFGDDVYIGWVHDGEVMEISAVDPKLGANFYTLSQEVKERPQFRRHTHECLQCHASSLTKGVPGHIVRSVYPLADGQPMLSAGTFLTDHSSPLKERWGGWYVTGKHGSQQHMGNLLLAANTDPTTLKLESTGNIVDLRTHFVTTGYASPHSDIVALLVLEHQTTMHNLLTQASFLTRVALRDAEVLNKMLDRPTDHQSDSTTRRIHNAAEPIVKYLLFSREAALIEPIQGTAGFAEEFATRGPRDLHGRSLRAFNLKTRLFQYPCSYLIYSAVFDRLPEQVQARVYKRLWEVLTGKDQSPDFEHLTAENRQAIWEILRETKAGLPEYWKEGAVTNPKK